MKKLHLLLLALMLSVVGMAQTKLTTSTGSLTIQNPNEGTTVTYPTDKLFFSLANNNVRIYLIGTGPGSTNIIANNVPAQYLLNGASGVDTSTVKTFLVANGVGRASAGGGGGGGGDASAANQITQIARETTIANNTTRQPALYTATQVSLTTTPTALPSASTVLIEIKNNAVNAVDINVSKGGGAVEIIPAGAVSRFDGITNANQLSISSSSGTPTVFYRLYTQLMQ